MRFFFQTSFLKASLIKGSHSWLFQKVKSSKFKLGLAWLTNNSWAWHLDNLFSRTQLTWCNGSKEPLFLLGIIHRGRLSVTPRIIEKKINNNGHSLKIMMMVKRKQNEDVRFSNLLGLLVIPSSSLLPLYQPSS